MSILSKDLNPSKTSLFFHKANKFLVIGGLPGYFKWQEGGYTRAIYKYIQNCLTIFIFIFIAMELGSFITQNNVSEKQAADMLILTCSHPILTSYRFIIEYHKERVQSLLYKLCIESKNVYNNPEVERQMIKKLTVYVVAFLLNLMSALVSYGFDGVMQASHVFQYLLACADATANFQISGAKGGTFVTVITAWPDVNDKSISANVGRIVGYLMWWVCMTRVSASIVLIIITTSCLGYQFKNVQSYFYSLNDIFAEVEGDVNSLQEIAEEKYEEALKVGIQLHADALWCTRQCQDVYSIVYSVQIIVNVAVVSVQLIQMMSSERTLLTTSTIFLTTASLLITSGTLMWNAGDVTTEAALVPAAMYSSGWQNCRGQRSQRVRKLLVIAMNQAQRHVVLRSFGVMEISYQAYVSMVKASYSAFSLIY